MRIAFRLFQIIIFAISANSFVFGQDTTLIVTGDGKVGIGTNIPQQKLHVVGIGRFDVRSDSHIDISTPGGWPGLITLTPGNHRRDIIFEF